jgi:hypothetical protein
MYICIYICMYICRYVHMCVHMYICKPPLKVGAEARAWLRVKSALWPKLLLSVWQTFLISFRPIDFPFSKGSV